MREWLEQGAGLMILGTVTGICFLVRVLLFGYYGRMNKECGRFKKSRHKSIVYIRDDLKRRYEAGQEIKNAVTYTECRLGECRVFGIRVGWLENMWTYSLFLVLLCGVMTTFAGALLGCDEAIVLFLLFMSGVTVLGLLVTDMILGLRDKYRRIRLIYRDYIENNWSAWVEWQEDNLLPEELAESAIKKETKPKRRDMKKSEVKDKPVNAGNRKKGKAQEEKRRLTEELLRERRQLEARSFAEQRKRIQEENPEPQIQEESAATKCVEERVEWSNKPVTETVDAEKERMPESSYELLLNEVLAEYLV